MVTTSFMKILNFFEILEILKCFEIFEILIFIALVKRRWSPSVPNKYKTFIQSGHGTKNPRKRFTLPVHSLLSIVLKTMDRSIVKQLEKVKNSNYNVENVVVMFIYWGTII